MAARGFVVPALLLLLAACAPKPVLYPNEQYKAAGEEQAKADVKDCAKKAKEHAKSKAAGKAAGETLEGAAVGAAAGAATGAIFGSAARGAAGGGVGGAVIGLMRGLLRLNHPSPARMALVNRCLNERGYDVAGWE